jgi:hypothetical protein
MIGMPITSNNIEDLRKFGGSLVVNGRHTCVPTCVLKQNKTFHLSDYFIFSLFLSVGIVSCYIFSLVHKRRISQF